MRILEENSTACDGQTNQIYSSSYPPGDADGPLEERPVGEDAVLHVDLELELAVLHPQEEAGAAAEVQVGAALKEGQNS